MESSVQPDVTRLLQEGSEGSRDALDRLLPYIYQELRRIAHYRLQGEREGHTLSTTALVHEAYLKLVDQRRVQWQNRAHFCGVAAQAMRRILLDYAKQHRAAKRGGGAPALALDDDRIALQERAEEVLALDEALQRLAAVDAQQSRIVECRFFGGLTIEETAAVLGISPATVKRDWNVARAWLYRELGRAAP